MEKVNNVKKLTRASMLLLFALIITFTGARFGGATFNSFFVGPLINAVILTAVLVTDIKFGVLVAAATPVLAALTGQLAAPMVPFAPFVMAANIICAVAFGICIKINEAYGKYIGIAAGAILKTAFLMIAVKYLISAFSLNMPQPVMTKLISVMSYPQFFTAVAGGIIALIFSPLLNKANKSVL
ncbi:hypothetical protein OXPF_30470 [Oxobacter pfennigii]|uniref:ECF transporter S component n=1 Tax=Oxobacter pfennigii TaxID=36849 RepID=A0A0P8WYV2_9CLOT|nr:ECF transporter S component [Oxobacter pfennigii]KPU43606.1 hypothetical protein OXPF_30470 [Oxobacter pfennigii]